jgi:hypothetical protein
MARINVDIGDSWVTIKKICRNRGFSNHQENLNGKMVLTLRNPSHMHSHLIIVEFTPIIDTIKNAEA